ncbi:DUF4332 domain-containing protein [Microseira sp. BLCC-F43]|uniref:DUF4332 domain-containing protein n=1 Tax=Microseira sp. BLCC-F43 TaxID=3153602 RepID=UPI0035BA7972
MNSSGSKNCFLQAPAFRHGVHDRLHQQILRLQVATMQGRDLCPSVEEVQGWIKQAQMLMANG